MTRMDRLMLVVGVLAVVMIVVGIVGKAVTGGYNERPATCCTDCKSAPRPAQTGTVGW